MSGHSKWANTKHRKSIQDTKRGKMFSKIIYELVTAAKIGGGDINSNHRLRAAVDKALINNMTRETLNRAISRGIGNDAQSSPDKQLELITYEGYGPGGTAIMINCVSNNRNRTVSKIRSAFNKTGSQLSVTGSVSYLFSKNGLILLTPKQNEDMIINLAIEAGVDEIMILKNGIISITTTAIKFNNVKELFDKNKISIVSAEILMIPSTYVTLNNENSLQLLNLIDKLNQCTDVNKVYHNGIIDKKN